MSNTRKVVVPQSGFTLIELVIVIIVLAIVSVFTGQFLSQNIDLYQRAVNQNERLSDARFIFNRMDKEFNSAIAFSVTDEQEQDCISFVHFSAAGQYLNHVAGKKQLTLIMDPVTRGKKGGNASGFEGQKLSVFTTDADDFYANSADTIASIKNYKVASDDDPTQAMVTLTSKLARDSMVSRYFIFDKQVNYCLVKAGGNTLNLYRKEVAVTGGSSTSVLMLSGLGNNSSMKLSQTTQVQHAMLDLKLDLLLRDNSPITFNHQLVMTNVP